METQVTTDYKLFKLLKDNRQLKRRHIDRLKESIANNNLLHINPILVNQDFYVIDGQHRLMAASELKVPIYYQVATLEDNSAVQILNTVKLNWMWKDYIHAYIVQGKEDYIWLTKLAENYTFNVSTVLRMLLGLQPTVITEMKNGTMVIKDKNKLIDQVRMLNEVSMFYDGFYRSEFVKAFRTMINHPKFDFERFMAQMNNMPGSIHNCVNYSEYLALLEKIYNRNVKAKNKIRLY